MRSAFVIRTDGTVQELDHRPTLEEAQEIVGGYVELVSVQDSKTGKLVTLVVNEDGKIMKLPTNRVVTEQYGRSIPGGYIVGNVIELTGWRTVA